MRRFFLPAILLGLLFSSVTASATDKLPLTIINGFSRQLQTADDLLIHDRLTSTAVLILEPGGTGALQGDTAGDARGTDATDWQRVRASNTQVASGANSVLSGGNSNTASGSHSVNSGGQLNDASGVNSVVSGGRSNTASATYGVVSGGFTNDNAGLASAIGGGRDITISSGANYSFCAGRLHEVTALYSVCYGLEARTLQRAELAISAGHFATAGDAQSCRLVLRRNTTDATGRSVFLDGSGDALDMPSNSMWTVEALVVALRDTGAEGAAYKITAAVRRDASANPVLVGTAVVTVIGEDVASWNAVFNVSGANPRFVVTGEASKTINWVVTMDITQTIVAN